MSKAIIIILPFFLLAGIASGSGSQQPEGGVVGGDKNYHDEDVEGGSRCNAGLLWLEQMT